MIVECVENPLKWHYYHYDRHFILTGLIEFLENFQDLLWTMAIHPALFLCIRSDCPRFSRALCLLEATSLAEKIKTRYDCAR